MSLQKQQARKWGAPRGALTPRPSSPLPKQSLPSCEPDPVTCLAAWGYLEPSLRASGAHRDDVCAQSKVTFVDAIGSSGD